MNTRVNSKTRGRQNSKFEVEQDRTAGLQLGRGSDRIQLKESNQVQTSNIVDQPKRIQATPRRPVVIIEDYDENEVEDRRTSHIERPRKRPDERKRPQFQKHKSSSGKPRPPAAAGCFQICDTLIFEVYKLLGGGLCDC